MEKAGHNIQGRKTSELPLQPPSYDKDWPALMALLILYLMMTVHPQYAIHLSLAYLTDWWWWTEYPSLYTQQVCSPMVHSNWGKHQDDSLEQIPHSPAQTEGL